MWFPLTRYRVSQGFKWDHKAVDLAPVERGNWQSLYGMPVRAHDIGASFGMDAASSFDYTANSAAIVKIA